MTRRFIQPSDYGRVQLPWSEVCCHMQVADKVMAFRLTDTKYPMVQLLNEDGSVFSAPILTGEAGLYRDGERFYYYPADKETATV